MAVFDNTVDWVSEGTVVASDFAVDSFVAVFTSGTISDSTVALADVTAIGGVLTSTLFVSTIAVYCAAFAALLGDDLQSIFVIFLAQFLGEVDDIGVGDDGSVRSLGAGTRDALEGTTVVNLDIEVTITNTAAATSGPPDRNVANTEEGSQVSGSSAVSLVDANRVFCFTDVHIDTVNSGAAAPSGGFSLQGGNSDVALSESSECADAVVVVSFSGKATDVRVAAESALVIFAGFAGIVHLDRRGVVISGSLSDESLVVVSSGIEVGGPTLETSMLVQDSSATRWDNDGTGLVVVSSSSSECFHKGVEVVGTYPEVTASAFETGMLADFHVPFARTFLFVGDFKGEGTGDSNRGSED